MKIMEQLRSIYSAPKFPPHITVFGDIEAKLEIIEKTVKESIIDIKPFTVKNSGIEFSDYIYKAAYISLEINSNLQYINKKLQDKLSEYSIYTFKPHISLLYHVVNDSQRKSILDEIKLDENFIIESIAIQEITEKVEDWKIVSGPIYLDEKND